MCIIPCHRSATAANQGDTWQSTKDFLTFIEAGYFNNRVTCERWIERGIFPPPVSLGPNTNGWAIEDLHEFDQRIRACESRHRIRTGCGAMLSAKRETPPATILTPRDAP